MERYYNRFIEDELIDCLENSPAVALLGPRQCGKSTMTRQLQKHFQGSVYLDLEDNTDLMKLSDPLLFFENHKDNLVCIDEIQLRPDLFPVLRTILDRNGKNGQLLMLGSASRDLIKQSSQTLAGRILYLELTPFLVPELETDNYKKIWLRGGFPGSVLLSSEKASIRWRKSFIQTFLERDIPQLGFNIPAQTLKRLWTMLAHSTGQILNSSKLGDSMGVSHTTLRSYIDLLSQTFMVRVLPPFEINIKKRLVKSPKVYIRDSGILHALLSIDTFDDLLGHPILGNSWEAFVVEQICTVYSDWEHFFYRTASGSELDLVLKKGMRTIGIEIKVSTAPKLSKGFWISLEDLSITEAYVIAPIEGSFPIHENVTVTSISDFLNRKH